MSAPTVVMHRPPLKRVDFGLKPRAPDPAECEGVRALRELGARIEYERVWRLVRQSAEGCNAPAGTDMTRYWQAQIDAGCNPGSGE